MTTTTEEMVTLKPCPFCGEKNYGWGRPEGDTVVECRNCGTRGPVEDSDHDAITAWNTRQAFSPTAVEVERLREALAMAVAEMSRARGRLETIAGCNEDRRIAAALGSTCDYARAALTPTNHEARS